jgi:hypothetical protein
MNQNIILTVIELTTSLIIEGIILSMIFNWIANKETQKQEQSLRSEMSNIETQNKLIFEQLQLEVRQAKTELISQIKESALKGGKNNG